MHGGLSFLKQELVGRIDQGLAALEVIPPHLEASREAVSVTVRGASDVSVCYVLCDGRVACADAPPPDCSVRYVCALPEAALDAWVARFGTMLEPVQLARGLVRLANPRALSLVTSNPVSFEVRVLEVPHLGDVEAAFGLGLAALPASCDFRLVAAYADLAQAKALGQGPQQLLAQGKLRVEGDIARAMGLGMLLMQLRRTSEP